MEDLYSKLRKMGHGPIKSLSICIDEYVGNILPVPKQRLVEVQIEEKLLDLEDTLNGTICKTNLVKSRDPVPCPPEKEYLDSLLIELDSLRFSYRKRFSDAQIARFNTAKNRYYDKYPSNQIGFYFRGS